jgi:hypothetical protein
MKFMKLLMLIFLTKLIICSKIKKTNTNSNTNINTNKYTNIKTDNHLNLKILKISKNQM